MVYHDANEPSLPWPLGKSFGWPMPPPPSTPDGSWRLAHGAPVLIVLGYLTCYLCRRGQVSGVRSVQAPANSL
jgi:hypothetical protein